MPPHKMIEFKEIPIAACIMVVLLRVPNVLINDGADLVSFEFKDDDDVRGVATAYAIGQQMVNAFEYEKARSYLYRKAREVRR